MLTLRLAFRTLTKNPMFALVAVGSLALGIGANTAIFSLLDQVLLRSLPVTDAGRLVVLHSTVQSPGHSRSDNSETVWSYPMYEDLRTRTDVFQGVLARAGAAMVVASESSANRTRGELVSGNFFEQLGVKAVRGRVLTERDDRVLGGHPVVVLSYGYWQRYFGGSDGVVGQKVLVNGQPMEVVGVAPESFQGLLRGETPNVFAPLAMRYQLIPMLDRTPNRRDMWLTLFAKLKPGVAAAQAESALAPFFQKILEQEAAEAQMKGAGAKEFLGQKLQLPPGGQGINDLREDLELPMYVLLAMVGLVLLITCSNLANLLVVRGVLRRREIAVRLAVGASRGNLISQMVVEGLLLGLLGGTAGLLVAQWTLDGLLRLLGEEASFLSSHIDPRVLVFNFVVAVVASLLFSVLPAWKASKTDVGTTLKEQSAGAGGSTTHARLRKAIVLAQVALSVLLLTGAGWFALSLYRLKNLNPGFQTSALLTFAIDPSLIGYTKERGMALYENLERRLAQIPGVVSVGAAQVQMLDNSHRASSVVAEGWKPADGERVSTDLNYVNAAFLPAIGVSLKQGRLLDEQDMRSGRKVAVVTEAFAQYFFAGQNPLGKKIGLGRDAKEPDREIVGVIRNVKHGGLREKDLKIAYLPYFQDDRLFSLTYFLKVRGDPAGPGPAVRAVVRELDAALPVHRLQTMDVVVERSLAGERLVATLSTAFGLLAALLCGLGLYGLMSYSVTSRKRDLGLRMALGADSGSVVGLVLRESFGTVLGGILIGLLAAIGMGRVVESLLFGLKASDPMVYLGAAGSLTVVALLAALIPVRTAVRIDPMSILRHE